MKCPICTEVNLVMTDRQGIEIDYCPNCRGVWLDRGELDKIIERTSPPQPGNVQPIVPQPEFRQDYREPRERSNHYPRGYDYRKKKKGLLGELFDF